MSAVIGKLFTKEEADKLFGKVLETTELSKSKVERLASETPEYIMFNFFNGALSVLNKNRSSIYGIYAAKSDDKYAIYSTSLLNELLEKGGEKVIYFEKRENHVTATNGSLTLEFSGWCPPNCF